MSDLIDRQAAIDMITNHWSDFSNKKNYKVALACVDAVPPTLPEPMKIDLSRYSKEDWERIKKEWANTPITAITAEPERIKGHWIDTNIFFPNTCGQFVHEVYCDKCHGIAYFRRTNNAYVGANICPNCGADMREVTT